MKYSKSQLAWVSYDFANSAFHLLIPTILFPLFFKTVILNNSYNSDFYWSIAISIPILLSGLIAPFLGALIDKRQNYRLFFIIVTSVTILLNFSLGIIYPSSIYMTILFSCCLLFFNLSQFSYDSFLPTQIQGKGLASLSGMGWGIGYLGGIVCMIPVYLIIKNVTLPDNYQAYQIAFIIVAIFYLLFTLPSFIFLKVKKTDTINATTPLKKVVNSILDWKNNREIFIFLIAFYLINDALATLVYFTTIFASTTLNMPTNEILASFLIVQIIGIPSTIIFCNLSEKFGYIKTFILTIILWLLISVFFLIVNSTTHFYILSVLVGLVIGTTPALARAILATFLKKRTDIAEIFGFNSFASRSSSILGPLIFGIISTVTKNQKLALASLFFFFIVGLLLILKIKDTKVE